MPFSHYMAERLGTIRLNSDSKVVAGEFASLHMTFTAGSFGVDDTGGLKISWRNTSDLAVPQFADPAAANYTTATASNGVDLEVRYETRLNRRPWGNTLLIRVSKGFLSEGDTIDIRLGDPRQGSPGIRMQTNAERDFPLGCFVDAFATYEWAPILGSPRLQIMPGEASEYRLILPTLRAPGDPLRLAIVPADRWGNPTSEAEGEFRLEAERVPGGSNSGKPGLEGLPASLNLKRRQAPIVLDGITADGPGEWRISMKDAAGSTLAVSNPLRVTEGTGDRGYWGDPHSQSGETVGSGSARDMLLFARDKSFLDITGHQGNDFQIDDAFWGELNRLSAELSKDGEFVVLPGYEWSGNTCVGGDRNVFFRKEGRPIFRSSRILLEDQAPSGNDCFTVEALFGALEKEDVVVIAHVGGRYANIERAHDGRIERSVEIHSSWGTFEWLLHDAFELGYRVGVVSHSDDHKGRPGAALPGAKKFGAMGGITCYLMHELTRDAVFETMRKRRHYGTTGARLLLDVRARFDAPAHRFAEDPRLGASDGEAVSEAMMGDIVRSAERKVAFAIDAVGASPVERVTVFNGAEPVATLRTFEEADLGRRIRVLCEGAMCRGRSREVNWKGTLAVTGNRIERIAPINFFNPDLQPVLSEAGNEVTWQAVTTGNFTGFDIWLEQPDKGELKIATNVLEACFDCASIGLEDTVVDAGGLGRRMRLFRLPDTLDQHRFAATVPLELKGEGDNPLYVRLTQEDGHQAWTSPIYVFSD